jgi:rhodanese-related sulfurtransferase
MSHSDVTSPARIDVLLERARQGLVRVSPSEAEALTRHGGVLVDIRPSELRLRDGEIPGALIIDRNALEWRVDPTSPFRLPDVDASFAHRPVIVVCDEGYASSLAAASLQAIGLSRATDLDGGFKAWRQAGLPVVVPGS